MTAITFGLRQLYQYMDSPSKQRDLWITQFMWGTGIFVTITLSALAYLSVETNNLSRKLSVIEATSINNRDVEQIKESVFRMNLTLAELKQQDPPRWVTDKISEVERRVAAIERKGR